MKTFRIFYGAKKPIVARGFYNALCGEHCIAPDIALESDELRAALVARDDAEVARILTEDL